MLIWSIHHPMWHLRHVIPQRIHPLVSIIHMHMATWPWQRRSSSTRRHIFPKWSVCQRHRWLNHQEQQIVIITPFSNLYPRNYSLVIMYVQWNFVLLWENRVCFSSKTHSNSSSSHSPQSTSTVTPNGTSSSTAGNTQKRLHVSNIPFRFRDDDLKAMFEVSETSER